MGTHFSDSYLEHNARSIVELETRLAPKAGDAAIRMFCRPEDAHEAAELIEERRMIAKAVRYLRRLCGDDPRKIHTLLFETRIRLEHQLGQPLNAFKGFPRAEK